MTPERFQTLASGVMMAALVVVVVVTVVVFGAFR